ncbi:MAG: Hint domain-containing protein [Cypionkella sp.]|uniref:Hint domain-containing protein n=1 Tax=Cypionkella sp. TaxID=2811411 RepID=UPI002AB8E60E|nr:Hint domain-containing protein [Cypionkella sp.]MDZ4310836.1 Hint domain-containing protein [Cypionkella sp.]MDZ4392542.1 Hint domain-containing protein [Cypionkella sp.]
MTIHTKVTAAKSTAGLDHGLAIGTPVLSLDGMMPVEYLHPGDRVITRTGARKLMAIEVTLVQNARVIRISAGVLGADRPAEEMIVSPDQPILIRDWRAKAMTGAKVALIAAADLVDGAYIRAEVMAELRLYTLRFEEDVVIYAGDLELACTGATLAA